MAENLILFFLSLANVILVRKKKKERTVVGVLSLLFLIIRSLASFMLILDYCVNAYYKRKTEKEKEEALKAEAAAGKGKRKEIGRERKYSVFYNV